MTILFQVPQTRKSVEICRNPLDLIWLFSSCLQKILFPNFTITVPSYWHGNSPFSQVGEILPSRCSYRPAIAEETTGLDMSNAVHSTSTFTSLGTTLKEQPP
jgi:hypothetical protein